MGETTSETMNTEPEKRFSATEFTENTEEKHKDYLYQTIPVKTGVFSVISELSVASNRRIRAEGNVRRLRREHLPSSAESKTASQTSFQSTQRQRPIHLNCEI